VVVAAILIKVITIIITLVTGIVLVVSAEKLSAWLQRWCRTMGWDKFGATAVLMAAATSLPELAVTVVSSVQDKGEIGLGNALGSNLVNLALVLGLTGVAAKTVKFEGGWKDREILPIWLTLIPYALVLGDGRIGRAEGGILVLVFLLFVMRMTKQKMNSYEHHQHHPARILGHLGLWTAGLVGASMALINSASQLASGLGIPPIIVGLFVVAIGTSLPELVFNLAAVKKGRREMAMGNIVGSCVFNSTLVVGLAAIINPIVLSSRSVMWGPTVQYLLILAVLMAFIRSKNKLERWESATLVGLFVYYLLIETLI
jgi:cation:H+ antiporter